MKTKHHRRFDVYNGQRVGTNKKLPLELVCFSTFSRWSQPRALLSFCSATPNFPPKPFAASTLAVCVFVCTWNLFLYLSHLLGETNCVFVCICSLYSYLSHLGGVLVNLADEIVAHGRLVHPVLLNPKLSSVPASPHHIYANIRKTVMDLAEIIFPLRTLHVAQLSLNPD